MIEIVAGIVVAVVAGMPVAYAERHGPLPLLLAALALLVGAVIALFVLGDRILIDTRSPLLLLAYFVGVLGTQRAANRWWGRERFWRRGGGSGARPTGRARGR